MGARKPGSQGERAISVKTIAQGRPGCLGQTCGECRLLFCCRRATGAASARPSLRPLSTSRAMSLQNPGAIAPRQDERASFGCLTVESEIEGVVAWAAKRRREAFALLASPSSLSRCSSFAGRASPLRSRVTAPRLARKGAAWCPWPESNQHSLRNSILSRARLPIPPQGHSPTGPRIGKGRGRKAGGI